MGDVEVPERQFVEQLEARRRGLGLGHGAFAARLGWLPSDWSRVRLGRRAVSRGLAERVIARWPEFSHYYAADLMAAARARGAAVQPERRGGVTP